MKNKATEKFVRRLLLETRKEEINEGLGDFVKSAVGKITSAISGNKEKEEPPKKESPKEPPEETPEDTKKRIAYLAKLVEDDSEKQATAAAQNFANAIGNMAFPIVNEDSISTFARELAGLNDTYGKLFRYVLDKVPDIIGALKLFKTLSGGLTPDKEQYERFKEESLEVGKLLSKVGITPLTKYKYNEYTYPIPPITNFLYGKKFVIKARDVLPERVLVEKNPIDIKIEGPLTGIKARVFSVGKTPFYVLAYYSNPLKNLNDPEFNFLQDFYLGWFTDYEKKVGHKMSRMREFVDKNIEAIQSVALVENVNPFNLTRLQKLAGILKD